MVENELYHHGILGMRWGVRRYQNSDGSLTAAGKKRYNTYAGKSDKYKAKSEQYAEKTPAHYLTGFGQHKQRKMAAKSISNSAKANDQKKKAETFAAKSALNKLNEQNDTAGQEAVKKYINSVKRNGLVKDIDRQLVNEGRLIVQVYMEENGLV